MMQANFPSGVGPCMGVVEPLKQVLRVTAHPQNLPLELRAPMSACSGQYGIPYYQPPVGHESIIKSFVTQQLSDHSPGGGSAYPLMRSARTLSCTKSSV